MRSPTSFTPAREKAFVAGLFVDALGSGLYLPLTLLFVRELTGLSAAAVGLSVTVAAGFGLAASPAAGALIDRIGARRVLVSTYVLRALGFAAYPFVHGFPGLVLVAAVIAAGDRAYYPAFASQAAALGEGPARDRLYGLAATTRNVGFGLGGLLSAGAVSLAGHTGFALVASANAVSFLAAGCLVLGGSAVPPDQVERVPRVRGGYRRVLADRPFMRLVGAEQAFTLAHAILPVALPVYAVSVLGAPPALLGLLYTLNTALLAVGQLPVRRLQRNARRTHALALGGAVFALSCGAYALVAIVPGGTARNGALVAATLVYTLGELLHTVPSSALAASAAPAAVRGRYLTLHQFTWAVSAVIAPAGFSALLDAAPPLLWSLLGVVLVLAALTVVRLAGRLPAAAVSPRPAAGGRNRTGQAVSGAGERSR